MAKIYFKKYKKYIDDGILTLDEAIAKVEVEVPEKWRAEVVEMLIEAYPPIEPVVEEEIKENEEEPKEEIEE